MKNLFLIAFVLLLHFTRAGSYTFYDAINGTELSFTSISRSEDLAIDELNPVEEVGYRYFKFEDEILEQMRLETIYPKFKERALEASFKGKADSVAKQYFDRAVSDYKYYEKPKFQGYTVRYINLRPVSYLGNTLTFSFSAELELKALHDQWVSIEEIYYLNLKDFSVLPGRAVHDDLNHKELREALIRKWRDIKKELPGKSWAPVEVTIASEYEEYEEEYTGPEQKEFFTDSLIGYAVRSAELKNAEIIYTGAGVLVVLPDAVPWLPRDSIPLKLQLHLKAYEVRAALRKFAPYRDLQKAAEWKSERLPVDPYDFFQEAKYRNLTQAHIDYLRLRDNGVEAIERYAKNSPTDSQYIHQINYENGRAVAIDGHGNSHRYSYDSIVWEDNKVHAVISERIDRNHSYSSARDTNRFVQVQARDESGNTTWYLSTENGFYMYDYSYFDHRLAEYRYPLLSTDAESFLNNHLFWWKFEAEGICAESGDCAKVDEQGRPIVSFKDYYAYEADKLVQILGEREASTLFYYDAQQRLEEIIRTGSGQQETKFYYEADSRLPYHVEVKRPGATYPMNTYQIIHRR